MTRNKHLFAAMVVAGAVAAQSPAWAQTPEEFYAGKSVTLVVAAAAGGFADTVARSFAQVFEKHLPGKAEIVVQNMPGAGGLVGGAHIMNGADADGTVVGLLLGNVITTPLVTGNVQFDPRKVKYLGVIESDDYPYAVYAFDSSPVQSVDDLFKTKMVVGSTSFTNYNRVFPAMMNEYAGTRFEIVSGYQGSSEIYLAMERGEVDGWFEGTQTLRSPIGQSGEWIAAGRMKPLMLMATKADKRHPDIPVAMDYIKEPEQKAVANFIMASSATERPLAVPAGVPDDRLAALRTAVEETFADPELAEHMMKTAQINVSLTTYQELDASVVDFYAASDAILEKVRSFMLKK